MGECMWWGGGCKGDNGNTKEEHLATLGMGAGLGEMGEGSGHGAVSRKQKYLS